MSSGSLRLAVLASGGGTNFQALLDRLHADGESPVRIVQLIASRPGIGAIDRAERAGVPSCVMPEAVRSGSEDREARWLRDRLESAGAEFVVLAGYLRLVPPGVVRAYRGRMINIHPALLPAFGGEGMYGMRVHRAVCRSGARVTGVTVHFVNEQYDEGSIIAQWPVPVREGDDPESLADRVLRVEHRVLPAVVRAFAAGRVRLEQGRCRWRDDWFGADAFGPADPGESGWTGGHVRLDES